MLFNNTHKSGFGLDQKQTAHKKLWIVIIIVVVIFLIPILLLGWMGLIPGLSSLMGSANPRDLGVKYSQTDIDSYKKKTSVQLKDYSEAPIDPFNNNQKSVLSNPLSVSGIELTQEEITALLNSNTYSWMPIEDMQVRITNDVIEMSGSLNIDKIDELNNYVSGDNTASQDINEALAWAKRLRNRAPVYIKANAEITDNKLSFRLLDAEIGRLNIPLGSTGKALSSGNTSNINSQYFSAKSAKLANGALQFQGTYPTVIYLEP